MRVQRGWKTPPGPHPVHFCKYETTCLVNDQAFRRAFPSFRLSIPIQPVRYTERTEDTCTYDKPCPTLYIPNNPQPYQPIQPTHPSNLSKPQFSTETLYTYHVLSGDVNVQDIHVLIFDL
jgi:hypothetical protein